MKIAAVFNIALLALIQVTGAPVFFAQSAQADEQSIRISGAGLLGTVIEGYSKEYAKTQSGWEPTIVATTTGDGFQRFIQGQADLVMASRAINDSEARTAKENGLNVRERMMGRICLAIVTFSENPVTSLTVEQLRKVFAGEITNWKEVGGPDTRIIVTTRPVPETGAGVVFQREILKGAPYAAGHVVMDTYRQTRLYVSEKPAIGYIPVSSIHFQKLHNAKVLGIRLEPNSTPLLPEEFLVDRAEYPLTIPFYCYWNEGTQKGQAVTKFVEFSASLSGRTRLSSAMGIASR